MGGGSLGDYDASSKSRGGRSRGRRMVRTTTDRRMCARAQHAVATAIADSVAEGVIPRDQADELFIRVGVLIHWDAADSKKIQDYNYRATKEAIARAIRGDPKAAEVIAKRNLVKHPFAA